MSETYNHLTNLSELFHSSFHEEPIMITQLKGDASDRTLFRIKSKNHQVIGVYGPNRNENRAFLSFTNSFKKHNIPVPEIYSVHTISEYYVMEDLGDTTLFQHLQSLRKNQSGFPVHSIEPLYHNVIEMLIKMQVESIQDIDLSVCYQTKVFDEVAWKIDQQNFLQYFLINMIEDVETTHLNYEFEQLNNRLNQSSLEFFLYRDYQSRNMMLHSNRVVFIDYQSGRLGALAYDIASLLYDAKAEIPQECRTQWFNFYLHKLRNILDEKKIIEVRQTFEYYAILRILQALGSYGRNGIINKKKEYLSSIPYALRNLIQLIESVSNTISLKHLYNCVTLIYSSKSWEKWM